MIGIRVPQGRARLPPSHGLAGASPSQTACRLLLLPGAVLPFGCRMKRPAIFFDRDNTLMANDDYLGDASKVTLIPGAANAVARARALGFATVIFSNQSGVARGMFDEDAVGQVNARLEELLKAENPAAIIDRHEFCPFHPDGTVETYSQESPLRKPLPGMIHHAAEAMALDLSKSWVIGDASRDIEAGHAAGCRPILVRDPSLSLSPDRKSTRLNSSH